MTSLLDEEDPFMVQSLYPISGKKQDTSNKAYASLAVSIACNLYC